MRTKLQAFDNLEQAYINALLSAPDHEAEEMVRDSGADPADVRRRLRGAIERGCIAAPESPSEEWALHGALGRLLAAKRKESGLTLEELGERVRVSPVELRSIEVDVRYAPKPRTIHNLAGFLGVPVAAIQVLAGGRRGSVPGVEEAAFRFAARSRTDLSSAEHEAMREFVRVLCSRFEEK